jgi:hypothetical protein
LPDFAGLMLFFDWSLSITRISLKPPNNSRIDGKCSFGQRFAAAIPLCKTVSVQIGGMAYGQILSKVQSLIFLLEILFARIAV